MADVPRIPDHAWIRLAQDIGRVARATGPVEPVGARARLEAELGAETTARLLRRIAGARARARDVPTDDPGAA